MFTNILLSNKKICYNDYDSDGWVVATKSSVGDFMEMENEVLSQDISLESLTDENIIEAFQEVDSFIRIVEDEIKKTDVGTEDE